MSSFLTVANLSAVAIGLVTDGVIAIAMTMVLITGGFDLSVGSVLALGGMIVANLLHGGMGLAPAILITLAATGFVGLINGLIIAKIGVNPLILPHSSRTRPLPNASKSGCRKVDLLHPLDAWAVSNLSTEGGDMLLERNAFRPLRLSQGQSPLRLWN